MQDQARRPRSSLPATAVGSNTGAFGWVEWGLLAGTALIWGSSFLLMDVGLDAFNPGVITMLRVLLGAATLALFSKARAPIEREDRLRVAMLGMIWIAIPLTLFPIAQQWIDSSVAGMLNGGVPIAAAIWATLFLGRLPGWLQLTGIGIGFLGIVAIFLPEVETSSATALGAGLVILAVIMYGLSVNVAVPLQQRYGALPVLLRAQLAALVVVVPIGVIQLPGSTWDWKAAAAMVPLGVLSTGVAFVMMTNLVGRVGAARGSVSTYFIPIVAIALGVVFLGEAVAPMALIGTGMVILGAWIASRPEVPARIVTVTE